MTRLQKIDKKTQLIHNKKPQKTFHKKDYQMITLEIRIYQILLIIEALEEILLKEKNLQMKQ